MADSKITALTAITTVNPATYPLVIVDTSDTSMAITGTTKKVTTNQLLGSGGTATLASATITGDLTVATDRLKVVTGSTAIQTGSTTQLQVGTTAWPSGYIGKSGSRSLFGNTGEVIVWNESAAAIGNYSSFYLSAKTGAGATTLGGSMLRGGIENASDYSGFISLWTQTSAGAMTKRYEIDSSGNSVWSVGGSTAMTLNSTGLGVGASPVGRLNIANTGADVVTSMTAVGVQRWQFIVSNSTAAFSIYDQTNSATRLLIDTSGNVGVGVTPSAGRGAIQLSAGVGFPATQVASSDANTLDDYEEGTWTIVVNNQLGNSATIASQIARYVKIGRRVFVFGDFTLSAKGAAAAGNIVYLGNLPFVPNSTLFEGSVVHKYDNVNLTTNGQINIISAAGGNNVCFFPISSATTGTSNLTFGQITDTTRLVFNFSYDV